MCVFLQPSDDDTISLHSQVSESTREQTLRNDNHVMGSKLDPQKGNTSRAFGILGNRDTLLRESNVRKWHKITGSCVGIVFSSVQKTMSKSQAEKA